MDSTLHIDHLLTASANEGASDLHLKVDAPPMIRTKGRLIPLEGFPVVGLKLMMQLFAPLLDDNSKEVYRVQKSMDSGYLVKDVARFRVHLFMEMGKPAAVLRQIPEIIPTLEKLNAPRILKDFAAQPRGLVLVTGPTGSGKSTTLAASIDAINTNGNANILTIEDPVEFVHQSKQCLIRQREVGKDTPSYQQALKDALRADPDVILIGEMRNHETIELGLTAAETGHLVFATLHTSTAPSAIDRIVDVFPGNDKDQARTMLAGSLLGIVTQSLLPTADGKGRVAAHEILVANNPVRSAIRKGKTMSLRNELMTKSKEGMQSLDRAMAYLVQMGTISEDIARTKSVDLGEFDKYMTAIHDGRGVNPPDLLGEATGLSTA